MNLSIRARLFLICGALALLTALVGGAGSWALTRMERAFSSMVQRGLPAVTSLVEADRDMQQALVAQRNLMFMSMSSPDAQDQVRVHQERMADVERAWAEYKRMCGEPDPDVAAFEQSWKQWVDLSAETLEVLREDTPAARRDAVDLSVGSGTARFEEARSVLARLVQRRTTAAQQLVAAETQKAATMRRIVFGCVAGALLVGLLLAFLLSHSISKPLARAAEVFERMAQGDFSRRLGVKRGDEIGRLSASLDRTAGFLEEMSGAADRIACGDVSTRVEPRSTEDRLGTAFGRMTDSLGKMAAAAHSIAQGDLSVDVRAQSPSDQLGHSFETMVGSLRALSGAADRIARGDLSADIRPRSERDELGRTFQVMLAALREMSSAAERIARGDLSVEVRARSADDALGRSFERMTFSLRAMADAAERIACGDLEVDVRPQSADDRLAQAFARMVLSLRGMADAADRIACGDLDAEVGAASERDRLGQAFERMLRSLRGMADAAERIAQGDLHVELHPQSDRDRVAHAFTRMVARLTAMAAAAERVAHGELDVDVEPQSEEDRLGNAFAHMTAELREMASAADRIARGELDVDVTPQSKDDRLGVAFERMTGTLRAMASAADRIAAGDVSGTIVPQSPSDRLGQAFARMSDSLRELAGAADAIAAGDLGLEVRVQGENDRLGQAFRGMSLHLRSLVAEIRTSTVALGSDCSAIATGNEELSARTTTQARALEENRTALQHTAEAARSNASDCRQARELVENCQGVAGKGAELVRATRAAMDEIHASSDRIAENTRLIDSIASKTNLLALNARIEAARAGEHGRGFEVVAGEVRDLALKAAESARGIAQLVLESQQRIEHGTQSVSNTTKVFEDIVTSISGVTGIVQRLAETSNEQSISTDALLAQVGELEEITRQNAELAERMHRAGGQLDGRARELGQHVQRFRLEAKHARGARLPQDSAR